MEQVAPLLTFEISHADVVLRSYNISELVAQYTTRTAVRVNDVLEYSVSFAHVVPNFSNNTILVKIHGVGAANVQHITTAVETQNQTLRDYFRNTVTITQLL